MVGAVNTILSYVIYNFCYYALNSGVHIANITGFVITVFIAYLLQSRFVFRQDENAEKRVWWKVLLKTYVSYSFTGLFLTELLIWLWINVIDLGQYLGGVCEWLSGFRHNIRPVRPCGFAGAADESGCDYTGQFCNQQVLGVSAEEARRAG